MPSNSITNKIWSAQKWHRSALKWHKSAQEWHKSAKSLHLQIHTKCKKVQKSENTVHKMQKSATPAPEKIHQYSSSIQQYSFSIHSVLQYSSSSIHPFRERAICKCKSSYCHTDKQACIMGTVTHWSLRQRIDLNNQPSNWITSIQHHTFFQLSWRVMSPTPELPLAGCSLCLCSLGHQLWTSIVVKYKHTLRTENHSLNS